MNILFVISIYVVTGIIVATFYFIYGIKVHILLFFYIYDMMKNVEKIFKETDTQESVKKKEMSIFFLYIMVMIIILILCYIPLVNYMMYKTLDTKLKLVARIPAYLHKKQERRKL